LPVSAASVTSSSRLATRCHAGTPSAIAAERATKRLNSRWLPLPTTPITNGEPGDVDTKGTARGSVTKSAETPGPRIARSFSGSVPSVCT
jgi:hypothetical protein